MISAGGHVPDIGQGQDQGGGQGHRDGEGVIPGPGSSSYSTNIS